jgi:DNA repair exonuclease SbcCD ATPase subunit
MKDLFFTDLHLSVYKRFGIDDKLKLSKRLLDQKNVLQQILDKCKKYKIERVLFGGDFFHEDIAIPTEALNIAKWFFDELRLMRINFYACRGNHDLVRKENILDEYYSLRPFLKDNFLPEDIFWGHYDIEYDVTKIKGYNLVIMHKTPIGSKLHGYTFDEGIDWRTLSENNKLVLFGHIHIRQKLSWNCFVAGTPMALDFGDINERGVYIIKDEGAWEFCPLDYPKFITIEDSAELRDLSKNDYYRILNSDHNEVNGNIVKVKKPTFYENKIKSTSFVEILKEWLQVKEKPESYLSMINDLLQENTSTQKKILDLTLKKIEISNFLSFDKAELEVKKGFNLIEGSGGDFSSNGSGKTSLLESVYWCLFGETTKGLTGDDVIRKYPQKQKDCKVSLELEEGLDVIIIHRSRKDGLSVCINDKVVTEGMKLKESQEYLEQLFGFDKTIFSSSVFFSQESTLLLTKLGNADKNSIITSLLGFNQYDDLGIRVEAKLQANEALISIITQKKEATTLEIKFLDEKIKSLVKRKEEIVVKARITQQDGQKLKNEIIVKQEELDNLKGIQVNLTEFEQQEINLRHLLQKTIKGIPDVEKNIEKLEDDEQFKEWMVYKQTCLIDASVLIKEREKYTLELEELKSYKPGEKCKYCGSILNKADVPEHIKKHETKLSELKEQIHILHLQVEEKAKSIEQHEEKIEKEETFLVSLKQTERELLNSIVESKKKKEIAIEKANVKKQHELIIDGMKQKLSIFNKIIKESQDEFYKLGDEIGGQEEVKKAESRQLFLYEEEIVSKKEIIDILNFWKEAFSFRGVKSLLLDSFCNSFNDIVTLYMLEISNGVISVEFSPVSTTKGGEYRNKLDLLIYVGGHLQNYESLSGGEKKRVDCAVALSFACWLKKQYSLKTSLLGILVFDELFDSLDDSARECLLPILRAEGENQAVFCISHSNDLSHSADRIIKVKKVNRVSELI